MIILVAWLSFCRSHRYISGLAVGAVDLINCSWSVLKPEDRPGAVYKIHCSDCQATYIGETSRNLTTRLTEHKRATRKGDLNNNIAEHHLKTNHAIDWDSAMCLTYSTDYYQRITLESWFTNLEQTALNRCQPLPAPYKRLLNRKQ